MNGYLGKLLRVDLTTGKLWDEPLNEAYARDYVGGSGLGARYLYDMLSASTDPLGPENPLIFMTGPLVGTSMPSSSRFSVCARSPLTGIWGEANSGGFFGAELRSAGYDGILITGSSPEPVWLSIVEGQARLHRADALWGSDLYAVQDHLRQTLGDPKVRVACIGESGENLVKFAGIMNDHGRTAARTGLGAVMGSKKLKAIAVRGTKKPELADPAGFKTVTGEIVSGVREDVSAQAIQLAGTAGYVNMGLMNGDMPVRHFQQGVWEDGENLSGVLVSTQHLNRRTSCYRCPIGCGRETHSEAYQAPVVDGPEYESLGALGTMLLVSDLDAVIYANHLCNVYGLDTISMGGTLSLVCELFERGLLTPEDTGGLEVRYGEAAVFHRLIEMTARREGFGEILAEGSAAVAEKYGAPDVAVVVNRLEVPMHDPRAYHSMAVTYALSPRGACHMQGDMYGVDNGQSMAIEVGIEPGDRLESSPEKGRVAARHQAWRNLYNSLTLCQFQNPPVDMLLRAINTATGWDWAPGDMMAAGKRIVNLKRAINMRLGLTRANDRLPDLLMKPLAEGGTEGTVPDLEALLSGAYAEFDWDLDTGAPGAAFLENLK